MCEKQLEPGEWTIDAKHGVALYLTDGEGGLVRLDDGSDPLSQRHYGFARVLMEEAERRRYPMTSLQGRADG